MKIHHIVFSCFLLTALCDVFIVEAQPSNSQNYVIDNTVKLAGITNEAYIPSIPISTQGKAQSIAYMDGLGRPLQTVVTQGSASQKDIVGLIVYDAFGRETKKYLPYADLGINTNYGSFKNDWTTKQPAFYNGQLTGVDPDASPYSQAVLESSPLNRLLAQGAPGTVWQPNLNDPYDASKKTVQIKYEINKVEDNVRVFNVSAGTVISSPGNYAAGQLTIQTSIDEHGGVVKEYKDKSGHTVLKRVFISSDSLQTIYIYDDLEMLRAVIQPEGVAAIPGSGSWTTDNVFTGKWVFLYRYDERIRMVMKKIPGADSVLMVYDKRDRVVLIQDGNLRVQSSWLFTKYDNFNRPIVTGSITDTRTQDAVRADVSASTNFYETINTAVPEGYSLNNSFPSSTAYTLTLFAITHYDSYANLPSWSSSYGFVNEYGIASKNDNLQGQVVASQTKIINTSNWLRSVMYYDDKYRSIQVKGDNAAGGKDRISRLLSFDGKGLQEYQSHTSRFYTSGIVTKRTYSYDHADRVLKITHKIGNLEEVTISENAYNELGQLLTKKIHQAASRPGYLQKLNYFYNIRGWLNGVNKTNTADPNYDESNLFDFELHYNTTALPGSLAQYNGNIAEQVWKGGYDEYAKGYNYKYDLANRLNYSTYARYINGIWDQAVRYDQNIPYYDRNGNILRLELYHGSSGLINALNFNIWDGNKLIGVTNTVPNPIPVGYHDKQAPYDDYAYDANGNMTLDYNKDLSNITYNHLNLPSVITVTNKGTITYTYDAAGNKLQKTTTDISVSPNKTTTNIYCGPLVYRNDTLEFISHEEGRIRPIKADTTQPLTQTNIKYIYDYFMKDYLGNTRMVLTTESQTDLYAATMEPASAVKENLLFNNISSTTTPKPAGFDNIAANTQVARLHGDINTAGNKRVGPSIVLKVMAGDTISLSSYAWYMGSTQAPPAGLPAIATELLTLLTNGVIATNGTHGGAVPTTDINNGANGALTYFLNNVQTYDATRPKAFLNWMVVDEDFKQVSSSLHMGAVQIPLITGATQKQLLVGPANMVVRRGGWIYVYVSNESNQNVYFDDLVINHKRGPVLEETHYYPFGLTMAGISFKAAGKLQNKYKYANRELQSAEFSDGSGLEEYDFASRFYDPQIGRFHSIDPLCEYMRRWSPYNYAFDNPVRFADGNGTMPGDSLHPTVLPEVIVTGTKKQSTLSSVGSFLWGAVDWIPFAGSIKQIGIGIYHGDWKEAGLGVAFLAVDVFTAGEGGELLRAGEVLAEDALKIGAEDEVKEIVEKEIIEQAEKDVAESAGEKTYQTYTKANEATGEVYSGRTSGKGTPAENVAARNKGHHMNDKGFGPAKLDKSSTSKNAIRGREQQLITKNGGTKSMGGKSGNAINGIGANNKKAGIYMDAAKKAFGH